MSMRIHVAKVHCIKWDELPYLNYKSYEFKCLMGALGCCVYEESNEEGSSVSLEIPDEEFDEAISKLENWDSLDEDEREEIQYALDKCEFTKEDAYKCLSMCMDSRKSVHKMNKKLTRLTHNLSRKEVIKSGDEKLLNEVRDLLNEITNVQKLTTKLEQLTNNLSRKNAIELRDVNLLYEISGLLNQFTPDGYYHFAFY